MAEKNISTGGKKKLAVDREKVNLISRLIYDLIFLQFQNLIF